MQISWESWRGDVQYHTLYGCVLAGYILIPGVLTMKPISPNYGYQRDREPSIVGKCEECSVGLASDAYASCTTTTTKFSRSRLWVTASLMTSWQSYSW